MLDSLFNKVATLLKKKKTTQTQVFSCECCEIFENNYFEENLQTAASDSIKEDT